MTPSNWMFVAAIGASIAFAAMMLVEGSAQQCGGLAALTLTWTLAAAIARDLGH